MNTGQAPESATPRRARRRAVLTAAIVAALVCGLLIAYLTGRSGGSPAQPGEPTGTPALWRLAPTANAVPPFDYDAAVLALKRQGYTVLDGPARQGSRGPLRVFVAVCTGSIDGHCLVAFFFHEGNLVEHIGATAVSIHSQDGHTVSLDFPQYLACDPLGGPSGGTKTFSFHWDGSSVVPDEALPSDLNNTYGDPNNPTCGATASAS